VDWMKIVVNAYHMAIFTASCYVAYYPTEYAWAIPVLQFYGQTAIPPDFNPGLKMPEVPRV
jgi:hypothetical protein